jgi:hypothetical protein
VTFICVCCTSNSTIKPNDYTKENKKIPLSFGDEPTVLVFLVESNLEKEEWKYKVTKDNKRQINDIVPLYYKGKYEIITSRNEFYKYEDKSLYRYILHFKTFFPTTNGRVGEYSLNYGDDSYQIFIEDMATGLHYEPSIRTSDYEGLLKVYAEYLEKERDKSE